MSQILRDECQLDPAEPIVVGVSGGPDSLCTLDVLERCGYSPVVAHFNHQLRPEAEAESEIIRQLAENRKLPFIKGADDVAARAEKRHESLEEAARNARYHFLFASAKSVAAQAVAVGHSADDQAETVLMHLLRGAGMDGLSGMEFRALPNAWSEKIPLVRPLLGVWRAQIMEYCQEQGFDPIIDATNEDQTFFRNRLRHELLPILESYNPSIRKLLWRTAEVMQGDRELVNQAVDTAWQECLVSEGSNYVVIDPQRASQQSLSVQRHLIRRAIGSLRPGLRDIGFAAIEQVRKYFQDFQPPAEI
ncbi:MAG: tRNA lysidine(34) synthetase TilS, partial [Anaerolineales bacterium]